MFVKIMLLFSFLIFMMNNVNSDEKRNPIYTIGIIQKDYNKFKEGADPCAELSSNSKAVKTACNKVAIEVNIASSGGLNFDQGYPKCVDATIDVWNDAGDQIINEAAAKFLVCCTQMKEYPLGKGKFKKAISYFDCPPNVKCTYYYDLADAFSGNGDGSYFIGITQPDYDKFQGLDPCDTLSSNPNLVKTACTKAAVDAKVISKDEKLTFDEGYPKCVDGVIEIFDNKKGVKINTIPTKLVDCCTQMKDYPIGKGLDKKKIALVYFKCQQTKCSAYYAVPN